MFEICRKKYDFSNMRAKGNTTYIFFEEDNYAQKSTLTICQSYYFCRENKIETSLVNFKHCGPC